MAEEKSREFLDPQVLAQLAHLPLVSRFAMEGSVSGHHKSPHRGSSVEFADHKPYVVGDDLRFIDWNILIRLDRLFIKLFEEEEDLHFHVLIDVSPSMTFGEPTKLHFAKQTAAALAFVGLVNQDRVNISTFAGDVVSTMPAARGRRSFLRVLQFLENASASEASGSDLAKTCRTLALRTPGKGVVVLISDLLDKGGYEAALRYLLARQMDLYVIHVLAKEEVDPELTGDLQLIDCEDGDLAEITVSAPLLRRYKANLEAFCSSVRDFCTRREIGRAHV